MKSSTLFSTITLAALTIAGSAFAFSQLQTEKGPRPIAVAAAEQHSTDLSKDPRAITTTTILIGNEDNAPAKVPVPTSRPAEFNFVPAKVPVPTPKPAQSSQAPVVAPVKTAQAKSGPVPPRSIPHVAPSNDDELVAYTEGAFVVDAKTRQPIMRCARTEKSFFGLGPEVCKF